MLDTVKIAAIQMDATPAPISERLQRAKPLIRLIVPTKVGLVVLPELFNTGYGYTAQNFQQAEPLIR